MAEALRGQGLGSRLLLAAEDLAVSRGCRGSCLGTFDFQARTFYERHGYAVFAELLGFPPATRTSTCGGARAQPSAVRS